MTDAAPLAIPPAPLNRAQGQLRIETKSVAGRSRLAHLYQRGAFKAVFPRSAALTAVQVNTAGGVTGGDRFHTTAKAGTDSHLTLTTQAAERAYRARPGETGRVTTELDVGDGAVLHWLPQETILFDGCDFARRLTCRLAPDAEALIVEPMIFGRSAMGETSLFGRVSDRIDIQQAGHAIHLDAWQLDGDLTAIMDRAGIGSGARAMASLTYVGPRAEAHLAMLRALLPETGGASLKHDQIVVARMLAPDGYRLRRTLLPILDRLTDHTLPTCWRL